MISRTHRTIFVHVPKTAGQSIEMVFLRALNLTWEGRAPLLLGANPDPTKEPRRLAHLYADEYVGHGYLTRRDFASYFKFAVVRNPWARAVSEYKYAYQRRGIHFSTFLSTVVGEGRGVRDRRHIDAQTRYLCDGNGRLLVDQVLRFENLRAEFAELSREIFGREESLPTINASADRTNYHQFYDEAGRRLIAEKFRDDSDAFGYEFGDCGDESGLRDGTP